MTPTAFEPVEETPREPWGFLDEFDRGGPEVTG
jgi:hypothetical protein